MILVVALALAVPLTAQLGMNGINLAIIGGCLVAIAFSLAFIVRARA